jgi:valyl-tRNA synthetase
MSKTRGNVIDPLELSARYGADALRFTLGIMAAQGRDIKLSVDRIEGYRNFLNKIWNASRFAMMNLEGVTQSALPEADLELADRWILSRLAQTAAVAQESLDTFRLNDAASALYSFVWHELCDWYIELVKARLYPEAEPKTRAAAQQTLLAVLEAALRLLHPFIPFVTEEIWQKLPRASGADSIMMTRYPTADSLPRGADPEADAAMAFVMGVIVALRTIRTETGVPPSKEVPAIVITSDLGQRILLESHTGHVMRLARASLTLVAAGERPGGAAAAVVQGAEIYVPLRGLIDVAAEHKRIEKEISKIARDRESAEKRLSNPSFVDRAPADVVAKEREKIAELAEKLEKLEASRARLAEIAGPDA